MSKIKKAIYKIENLLNHHIYIGQSIDPQRRFREHCTKNYHYISLVGEAIQKYGKENFSFEVLGWFEDYNEKEKYFISYYDCIAPKGYNIVEGGENPPIHKGQDNPAARITNQKAEQIIEMLLDWKIPRKKILAELQVSHDTIRHINDGDSWRCDDLSYPLRPQEAILDEYRALYIQWMCCTSKIPLNNLGALVGWGRSSAKMINQGHNHFDNRLKYPLRPNAEYNKKILEQNTCIDYLHFGE